MSTPSGNGLFADPYMVDSVERPSHANVDSSHTLMLGTQTPVATFNSNPNGTAPQEVNYAPDVPQESHMQQYKDKFNADPVVEPEGVNLDFEERTQNTGREANDDVDADLNLTEDSARGPTPQNVQSTQQTTQAMPENRTQQ